MGQFSLADAFEKSLRRLKGEQNNPYNKKTKEEEVREGEKNLVKALNDMYRAYRDRQTEKPNYDEKYPVQKFVPEFPNLPSDQTLRKKAEEVADGEMRDKREGAEQSYAESTEQLAEARGSAVENYEQSLKRANERAEKLELSTEGHLAENGIQNSTIADGLRKAAQEEGNRLREEAKNNLREAIEQNERLVKNAEERRNEALRGFEIAEAAKAEKEMKRLQRERAKVMDDFERDSKAEDLRILRENEARGEKIAADETARDKNFKESEAKIDQSESEYEGAKAVEMGNRYRVAEGFYSALPKEKALNLIMNSADELRGLLGNYYNRLIKKINNR